MFLFWNPYQYDLYLLLLSVWKKIKRRSLIELKQVRTHVSHIQGSERAGIAAQTLEMIERQSQEVRHGQLDRVGMEDNRNDILRLVMFPGNAFQRVDDARLHAHE